MKQMKFDSADQVYNYVVQNNLSATTILQMLAMQQLVRARQKIEHNGTYVPTLDEMVDNAVVQLTDFVPTMVTEELEIPEVDNLEDLLREIMVYEFAVPDKPWTRVTISLQ
jgi:hypothetical protein